MSQAVPPLLSLTHRLRQTPYHARVMAAGCKMFTVYNHMLLPAVFESLEADYHHLREHVQIWDVSCERQVEISGPDAFFLSQWMTPRDLSRCATGQCLYAPLVNEHCGVLNDPILLKLAEDRYWFSVADSDAVLWAQGLARGRGLDVVVREPAVFPLAVQGPKSFELLDRLFGEKVSKLGFFRFAMVQWQGTELLIARSGWSKQGGFEIYLQDPTYGHRLWDALFAAGEDLEVRAGCPNHIERIESGLLSYGSDVTADDDPLQCGLEAFCNLPESAEVLCREELQRRKGLTLTRSLVPVLLEGDPIPPAATWWPVSTDNVPVGQVRSAIRSSRLQANVGLAMLDSSAQHGTDLVVSLPDGSTRVVTVASLPFEARA